jgi:2-dehydropantoate 2-reductase
MPSLPNPVPSAMTPSPRVAVVGPGAVGAFLAAHLVAAGVEVVACARRPFDRYVIESEQYPADEPATVITDPSSAVPVDVVLVCVKVTQTGSIAPWLAALCGPHTLTVSVQNGLESADLLASVLPAGTVLPSVVYVGVQLVAPGHVRHTTAARLVVPDNDDGRRAAQVFTGSIVTADLVSDFRTEVWRKLGVNAAVNGITAITGRTTEVYSRPDAARLARDLLRECWSIARLDGAMLTTEQADSTAHNLSVRPIGAGTSMLYDRLAGAPTEHDAIYGAIVRAAERLGSDAPLARTLDTLLAAGDPN